MTRALQRAAALALAALALAGCGEKTEFRATDVTGAPFGQDFELPDHNGKPRRLADFRGSAVAIFFGYTHCPDVCPTTLSDLAQAVRQLGAEGERVQVLFVTVDPERDTPELLAKYVPAFNPRFLGLRGDAEATARTAKVFNVVYRKSGEGSSYTMDHSAGTYVYDPQGRLRLYFRYGETPESMVHDLRLLLAGK